jgi:hypothetical protein
MPEPTILTCATCGKRARMHPPLHVAREQAQRAGWRWTMNGRTAWCGDCSEGALSGAPDPAVENGVLARF